MSLLILGAELLGGLGGRIDSLKSKIILSTIKPSLFINQTSIVGDVKCAKYRNIADR